MNAEIRCQIAISKLTVIVQVFKVDRVVSDGLYHLLGYKLIWEVIFQGTKAKFFSNNFLIS